MTEYDDHDPLVRRSEAMKKLSKPSHQLNLEAVKVWAKSLSPEERAQWINSLLERNGIPAEPSAEQEALPLQELNQEAQPQELDLDLEEERRLGLELEALAQTLNQEVQNLTEEVHAQALKLEQEQKLKQAQKLKLEQAQKLKLEQAQKLKLEQAQKLKQEQAQKAKQEQAQKAKQEQAQKLKLDQAQKLKQDQALAQVKTLEQDQGERELERLAQALADGLDRKGG